MGYVDDNLIPGERVLLRAAPHWACFIVPSIPLVIAAVTLFLALTSENPAFCAAMSLIFILIGATEILKVGVVFFTTEFGLTDRRIIAKTGLLRRRSLELLLTKVESIQVSQPLVGRMLDYGTVVVVGTGGTHQRFRFIASPHDLRAKVNARLAAVA
jgi:uncharacterized membrane protein YdbT with pleckstrin-like domain